MTISGYSSAIVNTMLGWLKGFANWVLRLFNLAGSVSVSPLSWLSHNWLRLLIVFMVIGITADILVWLVRWRPHWVWFRKERVIVNDDRFFSDEGLKSEAEWEEDLEKNWHERDYVIASTVVKRREDQKPAGDAPRRRRRPSAQPSTVVRRHRAQADGGDSAQEGVGSFERGERRRPAGVAPLRRGSTEVERRSRRRMSEREKGMFGTEVAQQDTTDFYEDEVFNVSNLPKADEYAAEEET